MDFDRLFPDNREEGETRLKQCQLVMLRMFKIFDYLCRKYKIDYFLTGGTLLGAVRHKGFIPWDDDFDVAMTRKNYEKFVQLAVPELPNDIFFQTPETDPLYPACHCVEAKLRDKYSSYIRDRHKQEKKYRHDGIQLDLFIYDRAYLPNNYMVYVLNRLLIFRKHKGNEARAKVLKFIEKYSPVPLVYSSSYMCNKKFRNAGTYVKPGEIKELIRVPFEDTEALIPAGYHRYLKRQYNDYMKMPPLEKQRGHHGDDLPDPFTACDHEESLQWKDRKVSLAK
ncbi:MAG: LicD family protein [Ilyomonas sp.]